jgi:hypothetical protein
LQAIGENLNSWGDTRLNEALKRLEEGVSKVLSVTVAGSNVTLTSSNFIEDQARSAALILTGTPGATRQIIIPLVEKLYLVRNTTNADQTIGGATGTLATIRQGKWGWVVCDGTNTSTYDPELNDLKPATAALDMNGQKIVDVAAGTAATDVATLSNTVSQFAAPAAALAMNAQKITGLAAGTDATDAASLSNRLDQFAAPTATLSMGGQVVSNVGAPVATTDAATRGFVQSEIATAATINLPPVTGQSGRYLTNNGTVASWGVLDIAPDEFLIHALG